MVTDYDPDPRNPAVQIARDALLRLHGFLVPAMVGGDVDPGLQFYGYGPPMQDFNGAAVAGAVPPAAQGNAELSGALTAGPMGDPARRIFADRLRRRNGL